MIPSDTSAHAQRLRATDPARLARSLWLIYLFQALKSLQLFGAVAVPFYLEWAGVDYTRMFLLEGAYALFMVLLEVPTGTIADRFGRKQYSEYRHAHGCGRGVAATSCAAV